MIDRVLREAFCPISDPSDGSRTAAPLEQSERPVPLAVAEKTLIETKVPVRSAGRSPWRPER